MIVLDWSSRPRIKYMVLGGRTGGRAVNIMVKVANRDSSRSSFRLWLDFLNSLVWSRNLAAETNWNLIEHDTVPNSNDIRILCQFDF